MKKIIKITTALLMLFISANCFAAEKKSIICTTFPEYDWILNILGNQSENFQLTLLQNNGTDLHSYQPSFKDITKISTCDLFVYIGGESDSWVESVLAEAKNKNIKVVNLMNALGDSIYEEEIVEGMEAEEQESEEEPEYDEHIWLSIRNAIKLTKILSKEIQDLDAKNAEIYKTNTNQYVENLSALDNNFSEAVNSANTKTILVGDRFPFRYLTEDYGLKYYAAFVGCSSESNASFQTIAFLSGKMDELNLNNIITIEKSSKKIAKTIIGNTKNKNQQIIEMDSLQSITQKEIKNGKNYISAMEKNLEALKKALQ